MKTAHLALIAVGVGLVLAGLAGLVGAVPGFKIAGCTGLQQIPYSSTWRGTVLDSGGQPLAGATLELWYGATQVWPPITRTDSNGAYSFTITFTYPDKDYELIARFAGFSPGIRVVHTECSENVPVPPWVTVNDFTLERLPGVDAGFTWTASDLVLTVRDASSGGPTRWVWDWGDGGAQLNTTRSWANHTYAAAGAYVVTVTAIRGEDGAMDSASSDVTVTAPPSKGDSDSGESDRFTTTVDVTAPDRTVFWVLLGLGLLLVGIGAYLHREESGPGS